MLLVPVPWAGRVWALPFLTALAPSERYCREHSKRRKKLTDWGRQLVLQARRWMPGRPLVLVADSGFYALEFLAALLRRRLTCVTRLRLDRSEEHTSEHQSRQYLLCRLLLEKKNTQ